MKKNKVVFCLIFLFILFFIVNNSNAIEMTGAIKTKDNEQITLEFFFEAGANSFSVVNTKEGNYIISNDSLDDMVYSPSHLRIMIPEYDISSMLSLKNEAMLRDKINKFKLNVHIIRADGYSEYRYIPLSYSSGRRKDMPQTMRETLKGDPLFYVDYLTDMSNLKEIYVFKNGNNSSKDIKPLQEKIKNDYDIVLLYTTDIRSIEYDVIVFIDK